MAYTSYNVNAFVAEGCKGSPAAVAVLGEPLPDSRMLEIAAENGVPETAFILKRREGLNLRWFTPDLEMDLCGHATLASAHIAFTRLRQEMGENPSFDGDMLYFDTREGRIGVRNEGESRYTLDFPVREGKAAELPEAIYDSLSIKPDEVYLSRDYLLIYSDYKKIGQIEVCNRELFDTVDLGEGGVIVSAPGFGCYDFVSRFFTPKATILEDPVTGSAHCTLVPYWSSRLHLKAMRALQMSENRGELYCRLDAGRVLITGMAEEF